MALPPTSANVLQHALRAHLQIIYAYYGKQQTRKLHQQSQPILLILGGKSKWHSCSCNGLW